MVYSGARIDIHGAIWGGGGNGRTVIVLNTRSLRPGHDHSHYSFTVKFLPIDGLLGTRSGIQLL